MIVNRTFLGLVMLLFVSAGYSQNVRFTFQMGAAIPVGEFAASESKIDSGGFANTGVDIHFVAERVWENHVVFGVNLGYTVNALNVEAIQKIINPSIPGSVYIESQSFQNINLQVRLGYEIGLFKSKFNVVPFVDAGLGVFNSAYYFVLDGNGDTFSRKGNSGYSFLLSPGLDIWIPLNNFVNLKIYGTYQFANYAIDEEFAFKSNTTTIVYKTINYQYNTINAGIGFSLSF